VGTQKGGPIPVRDDAGQLHGYKRDRSGKSVISTFKPEVLTELAAAAGGKYWNVTVSEGEVDEILQEMGGLNRSDYAERRFLVYEDRFQFPLAIAVLLLLIEFSIPMRKKARLGLRPIPSALIGAVLLTSPQVWAVPADVYFENKKGLESYQNGKLEEAQQSFGSAQARDPSLPELKFNQGVVQMEKGDFEGAVQGFSGAAQGAMERKDSDLAGKSFYNLGGALSKKGDIEGALGSYLNAIEAAKSSKDLVLEKDARKNLELLVQQREKQKQKQKQKQDQEKQDAQEGQNKDQQQQPDDQQKQDSKNQDQQNDQQSQDQKKQDQDKKDPGKDQKGQNDEGTEEKKDQNQSSRGKKEFKSQKLSKEDADRVMAELSSRERELQNRLKKQRGNPRGQEKDW